MSKLFIVAKQESNFYFFKKKGFNIVKILDTSNVEAYINGLKENIDIDISNLNDGDIIELNSKSSYNVLYKHDSNDNAIVITNKCNSNCVMCPCSEFWRRKADIYDKERIISLISMIDPDTKFLTLTGGEPTLIGEVFFYILDAINLYLKNTKILILTNGRTLSNSEYFKKLLCHLPKDVRFGIPLYSNNSSLHDLITKSTNSFNETVIGLKNLISNHIETEIRIVPTLINNESLNKLCEFISNNFIGIDCVNIMAMELTGAAALNKDKVWIDYHKSFDAIKNGVIKLIEAGIDVRLYNFPLCEIDEGYKFISHRSISDYKVKYSKECENCRLKKECGGVFNSTQLITKMNLKAYEN